VAVRLPTLFLPHGAGPCFFMDWQPAGTWARMETLLRDVADHAGARPGAVVVISAHWEAPLFAVNAATAPGLLYDYSGFPAHTYRIAWPVPGSPALAGRIAGLLREHGLEHQRVTGRGLDHGVFVPMKLAFPEADLPVVQVSLRSDLDPAAHLELGRALAPLRDEGVLIVGSGMSFHNMHRFRFGGGPADADSQRFDAWLLDTLTGDPADREAALAGWASAPAARAAHPREEHLLPLHVAAGAAAGEPGERLLRDEVLGSVQSAFRFGAPAVPAPP
jgi:aromatic ring-opening dioxygenase catalytic subunit (LigB family)